VTSDVLNKEGLCIITCLTLEYGIVGSSCVGRATVDYQKDDHSPHTRKLGCELRIHSAVGGLKGCRATDRTRRICTTERGPGTLDAGRGTVDYQKNDHTPRNGIPGHELGILARSLLSPGYKIANLRSGSLGMVHLNDEVYGSNCGRCPVFIHDLLYSP
jgi:hypothetical protein